MPDVAGSSQSEYVLMTSTADITIRRADARDADSIARLAALDSTRPPSGLVLVAEAEGELVAAISADDGHVAADPFRHSAASAQRLRRHVEAVGHPRRAGGIRRWLRSPVEPLPGSRAA
jgi:hypothetical protein